MNLHYEALLSLQIINDEDHPNMHLGGRQGGLSLLGTIHELMYIDPFTFRNNESM